jgi:uncharacterized protein with FMN-binding domain
VARSGGGKGRISNDLVAASCAAVLTVYAAGYWRTRDAARRFETQAQERRPAMSASSATAAASPMAAEAAAPAHPSPEAAAESLPSTAAVTAPPAKEVVASASSKEASPPLPAASVLPAMPSPVETSVDAVAITTVNPPAAAAEAAPQAQPALVWRDGTYTGWGTSRHGDIKAQVVIRNGRIVESSVASCETRWPCDVIGSIIPQPVERQNADVDRVSRATESTNAYYYALVAALDNALPPSAGQAATPR